MSIETRVEFAKNALREMGRGDLADDLIAADALRLRYPNVEEPPMSWYHPFLSPLPIDDEILYRRAAALASLAEGYDDINYMCESCCRAPLNPGCKLITRVDFLAHRSCGVS